MHSDFDPYAQWLGIRTAERPVNNYDLLGLARYEADAAKINEHALQRIKAVKQQQMGPHAGLSQRLLNEISAARACLLDAGRKQAYDEFLRQHPQGGTAAGGLGAELAPLPQLPRAEAGPSWLSPLVLGPLLGIPTVGLAILALVALALGWGSNPQPAPPAPPIARREPDPPVSKPPRPPAVPSPPSPPSPPPAPKLEIEKQPPTSPGPPSSPAAPLIRPKTPRIFNPATGHDYQLVDTVMSWHEGKELCEKLGGHLATATSEAENEFLYQSFAQSRVCWLGGTDEKQEGVWRWVTSEPWQFANFAGGEPSNHQGVEHYVTMGNMPPLTVNGRPYFYRFGPKWNDHTASGDYLGTLIAHPICEWDQHDPAAVEAKGE